MQLYEHQRKPVKGYEGLYEVDIQGNVYSIVQTKSRRKRVLKPYKTHEGYLKVNLYDSAGKCKKFLVHRLVAEAFIDNPEKLPEVNHIDCNHSNNTVDNLEWIDRMSNLIHSYEHGKKRCGENHGCHKLTWDDVHEIRKKELSQKELAKKFGVAQCTISAIQLFKLWKEGDPVGKAI